MAEDGIKDADTEDGIAGRWALMVGAIAPGDVQIDVILFLTDRRGCRKDALYMASRKALSTCVLPDADALIGRNAAEDASRQE